MNKFITWLKDISIKKKLYFIITAMTLIISIQLVTLWLNTFLLSAARASVNGEAAWSKAQKDAVFHLHEYAYSHNEHDYQKFKEFMRAPLGDRIARIELGKPKPNLNIARQGLLDGKNHPEDIPTLINLFLYFNKLTFVNAAIESWAKGDPPLLELFSIGEKLHEKISAGTLSTLDRDKAINRIDELNLEMTALANNYSTILGEGNRWLQDLSFEIILSSTILIGFLSLLLTILIVIRIRYGITKIIAVSKKIEKSDLSERVEPYSKDELGQLAKSFNHMMNELEISMNKQKQVEERLRYLAQHDTLTGLISRSLLYDRINQAIAAAKRNRQHFAITYLDIDHFKTINDSLGHEEGDLLLIEAANRLMNSVRAIDTVARMGGDEFIILLVNIENKNAIIAVIEKIVAAFRKPFFIGNNKLAITLSIGISFYPQDGEDGNTLIKNADTALYNAKKHGRNNYQFYKKP